MQVKPISNRGSIVCRGCDSKNLVDFEERFDTHINKFICEKITENCSRINLNKIKA